MIPVTFAIASLVDPINTNVQKSGASEGVNMNES